MHEICGQRVLYFLTRWCSYSSSARDNQPSGTGYTCVHFTRPLTTLQHRSKPTWIQNMGRNATASLASSWRQWIEAALGSRNRPTRDNRCHAPCINTHIAHTRGFAQWADLNWPQHWPRIVIPPLLPWLHITLQRPWKNFENLPMFVRVMTECIVAQFIELGYSVIVTNFFLNSPVFGPPCSFYHMWYFWPVVHCMSSLTCWLRRFTSSSICSYSTCSQ